MTTKRKELTQWLRVATAAKALGVPRTTLVYRIAKGEYRTKTVGNVLFVALPVAAGESRAA